MPPVVTTNPAADVAPYPTVAAQHSAARRDRRKDRYDEVRRLLADGHSQHTFATMAEAEAFLWKSIASHPGRESAERGIVILIAMRHALTPGRSGIVQLTTRSDGVPQDGVISAQSGIPAV